MRIASMNVSGFSSRAYLPSTSRIRSRGTRMLENAIGCDHHSGMRYGEPYHILSVPKLGDKAAPKLGGSVQTTRASAALLWEATGNARSTLQAWIPSWVMSIAEAISVILAVYGYASVVTSSLRAASPCAINHAKRFSSLIHGNTIDVDEMHRKYAGGGCVGNHLL